MKYEDFVCRMQTQMKERLGENVQVQLHQIMKNNSVMLDALSVSEKGSQIAPTIYLNDFYKAYLDGMTMPEIAERIEAIYQKSRLEQSFDTSFYGDFEKVRQRLACRVINFAKNEELLKRIPYRKFLDLVVVVYYCFEDSRLGNGTILVYESHRKNWGVTQEELFDVARENTRKIQPEEFLDMECIMERCRELAPFRRETEDMREEKTMYVLTNKSNYFGAAGLIFDSVLQEIAEKIKSDFWVLPSSVHECIIVPEEFGLTKEELQEMVREINRCEVEEEDFLSDEVYFYQSEIHKLSS